MVGIIIKCTLFASPRKYPLILTKLVMGIFAVAFPAHRTCLSLRFLTFLTGTDGAYFFNTLELEHT